MRKELNNIVIRLLLLLLILSCPLMPAIAKKVKQPAGGGSSGNTEASGPKSTKVVIVLNTSDDNSKYKFGFCPEKITAFDTVPVPFSSGKIPLTVKEKNVIENSTFIADSDISNGLPGAYVYWQVLTYDQVKLELSIDGPMKNEDNVELNWSVSWKYGGSTYVLDSSQSIKGPKTVTVYKPSSTLQASANSTGLHIETEDLMGKNMTKPYVGTLTLIISAEKNRAKEGK